MSVPMNEVKDAATAIHLLTPLYVKSFGEMMTAGHQSITATRQPSGLWEMQFKVVRGDGRIIAGAIPFNPGPALFTDAEVEGEEPRLVKWGAIKLGPGVWQIDPSVVQVGFLHAFIIARGVPDPAPWEGA